MDQVFNPVTAAGMNISVTGTATLLTSLIDTASAGTTARWPTDPNMIKIKPEDGDIRLSFHNTLTPTALLGRLVKQGEPLVLSRKRLKEAKAIAVSGTVKCSIEMGVDIRT